MSAPSKSTASKPTATKVTASKPRKPRKPKLNVAAFTIGDASEVKMVGGNPTLMASPFADALRDSGSAENRRPYGKPEEGRWVGKTKHAPVKDAEEGEQLSQHIRSVAYALGVGSKCRVEKGPDGKLYVFFTAASKSERKNS